jgi:hypothetical protein
MPSLHKRKTKSLLSKATELAFAVPQVVAHRVSGFVLLVASHGSTSHRGGTRGQPLASDGR